MLFNYVICHIYFWIFIFLFFKVNYWFSYGLPLIVFLIFKVLIYFFIIDVNLDKIYFNFFLFCSSKAFYYLKFILLAKNSLFFKKFSQFLIWFSLVKKKLRLAIFSTERNCMAGELYLSSSLLNKQN